MATETAKSGNGHTSMPEGFTNLSARYAQYDAGIDARDIKKNLGKKGARIRGWILGLLSMPATISDPDTGEFKPWTAICIELSEACPSKVQDPENPDRVESKTAKPGEKIILSVTSALESLYERGLRDALESQDQVYECIIVPQVGKTRAGRSLWTYPEFGVAFANPQPRKASQVLTIGAARKAAALPAAAGATAPSRAPFSEDAKA